MPEFTASERHEALRIVEAHAPGRSADVEAVRVLGHSLSRKGDLPAALKVLAYAVALAPSSVEVRLTQLQAAANSEDRPGGAALAEAAVTAMPDDLRVAHFAARALRKNRDFARAAELWLRVAEGNPVNPAPLIDAAGCLIRARDLAGALDCAEQALGRDPASLEARNAHVEALKAMNRPAALGDAVAALAALDPAKALDHLPGLMAAGLYGSVAAVLRGCRAKGIAVDARLLGPLTRILRNVAQLAEAEGRTRDAAPLWKTIVEAEPENGDAEVGFRRCAAALVREADAALEGGNKAEATEILGAVLSLDPKEPEAARRFAGLLTGQGAWQRAAEVWLGCAAGSSGKARAEAARMAATLAGKLDALPTALALLARARDLDPNESSIRKWGNAAAERCLQVLNDAIESRRLAIAVESARALGDWQADNVKLARLSRRLVSDLSAQMREALEREESDAAAALAVLTLGIDPDHIAALKALGGQALKSQRYAEAAERYEQLARLEPNQPRHLERLGQAYRNLRDSGKAIDAFERLLRLDPENAQARARLSELTGRSGAPPQDRQASAV